jgi:2-polyprenyl-6-methoxyphenol hydroxylase-like FAD-dependent oxidoreductase
MRAPADPKLPVLIVGAGPTGLTLAVSLTMNGVPCRIIERQTERSDKSRAIVIHPRSMEYFRLLGIDGAFADAQKTTDVEAYILGVKVGAMSFGNYATKDTRFPYVSFVSRATTERVLEKRLNDLGVVVEFGVELTGMVQDDDAVTATMRVAGGVEELQCEYIVGCDGAHSRVRKELEVTFEGAAYPQSFLLADAHIDWQLSHEKLRVFLGRRGLMAFFPLVGSTASRLVMMRPPRASDEERDPTLQEMQDLAQFYTHRPVTLSNPQWLARFRLHHRGVGVYRLSRGFVAGDAAHIHSPVGGQGMNTGIQDAFNLAWKLAWVIKRQLNGADADLLLGSYHDERHPVGQKLLKTTDRAFQIAATGNLVLATLRNLTAPLVLPFLSRSRTVRFRAFRFISQLGIRYRRSPLNLTPRQPGNRPCQAGDRLPDLPLGDGSWLYDGLSLGGMTIVTIGVELPADLVPWSIRHLSDPAVTKALGVTTKAILVVRPDAHVAVRLDDERATPDALKDLIEHSWLAARDFTKA